MSWRLTIIGAGEVPLVPPPPPPPPPVQVVVNVTTTGAHTYTIGTDIPTNAGNVLVELAGGGGGGANGGSTSSAQGGGGGSAGYSSAILPAASIVSAGSLVVTIGTGGGAGSAGLSSEASLDAVLLVDNTGGSGGGGTGGGAGGHAGYTAPAKPGNVVDGSQGGNGGSSPGSGASGTSFLSGSPGAGGNGGGISSPGNSGGNGRGRITYPVPLISSITIAPNGTTVTWVLDRAMTGTGTGFSVKSGGTTRTLTYDSGDGTNTFIFHTSVVIPASAFSWAGIYVPGNMTSVAGGYALYRLNSTPVTNNSTQ